MSPAKKAPRPTLKAIQAARSAPVVRAARTAQAAAAKNSVALYALSHHEWGRTGGA